MFFRLIHGTMENRWIKIGRPAIGGFRDRIPGSSEQDRHAEAEPRLLGEHDAPASRGCVKPLDRREGLHRIVKLYESWGKANQAAPWRTKLDTVSDE